MQPDRTPSAATVEGNCVDASYVLDWLKQTGAPENIVALQEKVVEAAGGYISGADRVRSW
jgi:predicted phage gp36 major capsid-like protein